MKKSKSFLICGIALLVISIIFTGLIALKIDNRSFMPTCISGETPKENTGCCYTASCPTCADVVNTCGETTISFASLNLPVRDKISSNYILYKITNYLGYLPFLVVLCYCILGFIQLIKNKSFKKVEKGLFVFAGLLVVTFVTYFIFEKLNLNVRPFKIDGELEASYPSSHTLLTICISFGIIFLNRVVYSDKKPLRYLNACLAFLTAFIVAGRFLSGVHWATDIIGGLLIATSYVLIYHGVLLKICHKHDKIEKTKQGKK
ncbi:phosphatase PAP2 family protein [Candidatus Saccharibacteria bacterium]|nr:phosphatase PAP2 family protein [Candidatus Saccharibacteria bacterium]